MELETLKSVIRLTVLTTLLISYSCAIKPSVTISSSPEGASILIDGMKQEEKTPAKIKIWTNKSHVIQVEKEGYYPATDSVAPGGGGAGAKKPKMDFHFNLEPLPSKKIKDLKASSLKINLSDTADFFVGVMDVKLSGKIPADLQQPLTNAIISELTGLNKFRVIDRAKRDEVLKDRASHLAGCVEEKCSVEVGRLIGVNRMVISSISTIGSKFYITVKMVNVETGLVEGFSESVVGGGSEELPENIKAATMSIFK